MVVFQTYKESNVKSVFLIGMTVNDRVLELKWTYEVYYFIGFCLQKYLFTDVFENCIYFLKIEYNLRCFFEYSFYLVNATTHHPVVIHDTIAELMKLGSICQPATITGMCQTPNLTAPCTTPGTQAYLKWLKLSPWSFAALHETNKSHC